MSWNAEILQTWADGGQYKSLVSLNDGTARYVERFTYSGTTSALRAAVRSWIDVVEARPVSAPSSGAIDCSPFPASPPPTQEDIDRAEFARVWVRNQQLKNAVAAGLVAPDAVLVQRSTSSVSALWQPSYFDLCRTV